MGIAPRQRVLEIGPGPGRLLIPAARRVLPGGEVVGIELQPRMSEKLRARAEKAGVGNLQIVQSDITVAAIEPARFDVVFLSTVLGEIPDRLTALRKAYQALKPGGMLSITEIVLDPHFQRRATVRRLAQEAGFTEEAILGTWWHFTANFRKP